MVEFVKILLGFFAPTIIAFMTPARCLAVFKAVTSTIAFVSANHADLSLDEQYDKAMVFLIDEYNLLDEVCGIDADIDKFFKETFFPLLLSFVYGGHHSAGAENNG